MDMYAKRADISSAERVLDEMSEKPYFLDFYDCGFLAEQFYYQAVETFREVPRKSLDSPDQVSYSGVLSASANMRWLEFGRQVHGFAFEHGLVTSAHVKNLLIDIYCKCGLFYDAVKFVQC